MEIFSSVWHLISAIFVFFAGAFFSVWSAKRLFIGSKRALLIYVWHTFFSMLYLWYVLNYGGDSIGYFQDAINIGGYFTFGTNAVTYLTGLLVRGLGLSILGAFLVFNMFGVIGLLAFDSCLRTATQNKPRYLQRLATIIVFLPSVSFWSSAIGKDALSFMAAGLALWAALALNRRWLLMAFAVAVMLLVRPHMAGMMVMAWTFAILLSRKTSLGKKVFLGVLSAITAAVMVPFALQYAGVGEVVDIENLIAYVEQRQSFNMEGGGGVDISAMSLPMQLFTYMFRPVIFEANTVFALAASVDNLILLYLFAIGGWAVLRGRKSGLGESRAFMWSYALLAWLVLAMTTANLGISLRQKWMFAPMLIFLLISVIGVKKTRKTNDTTVLTGRHMAKAGPITGSTQ